MKSLFSVLFALVLTLGTAAARPADTAMVQLAEQLVASASTTLDAAQACQERSNPPLFRNWRLRNNLKDIRKIALGVRDRAAKGKARGMIGKLKIKRIVANMKTCNFLIMHEAAEGLEGFTEAWEQTRAAIGSLVSELCCGSDS